MKCLIVDDEAHALDVLETYIDRIDDLHLAGRCTNAIEAFNQLKKEPVDLLFLDIQMPRLTGIEFLKNIDNPPKVIFTTAYRDYALEGYELNVLDYLLKPISFERFLKAVNKAWDRPSAPVSTQPVSFQEKRQEDPFLFLKADKKMVKVKLADILWIESLKDYVMVKTAEKEVITYQKISYLDEKLPEDQFIRVHRSFIVSRDKIDAFSATQVEIGSHSIPIGRNYKTEVIEELSKDNFLDD